MHRSWPAFDEHNDCSQAVLIIESDVMLYTSIFIGNSQCLPNRCGFYST